MGIVRFGKSSRALRMSAVQYAVQCYVTKVTHARRVASELAPDLFFASALISTLPFGTAASAMVQVSPPAGLWVFLLLFQPSFQPALSAD